MNRQQQRFIKLNGDPVHMSPLRAAFHRASVQVSAFSAIAATAVTLAHQSNGHAMITLAGGILGVGAGFLNSWAEGYSLRTAFGRVRTDIACIDKHPDENTPPTAHADMTAARDQVNTAWEATLNSAASTLILCPLLFQIADIAPSMPEAYAGAGLVASSGSHTITHNIARFLRFKNVLDLEWAIVNTPAPEKKNQSVMAPHAAPQPT